MTRAERALQLLADLAKCRLSGDTYQGGMVELGLDELDAEGGYRRANRVEGPAELGRGQRRAKRIAERAGNAGA